MSKALLAGRSRRSQEQVMGPFGLVDKPVWTERKEADYVAAMSFDGEDPDEPEDRRTYIEEDQP